MKKKWSLIAWTLLVAPLNLALAGNPPLPAPLPEFMNQQQLAQWSARQASKAQLAAAPETQFYTGKPYVADVDGYIYKYRTYNPEMSRWTSADPSGFPDGVNNFSYTSDPVSQGDRLGLFLSGGSGDPDETSDEAYWRAAAAAEVALGWDLASTALFDAEGNVGTWNLTSSQASEIQGSNLYQTSVYPKIQATLEADVQPGESVMDTNPMKPSFSKSTDPDEYYAFHSLTFSTIGNLTWNNGSWTYTATVSLYKYWSFSNYGSGGVANPTADQYNQVGYRLQYYGYIDPYTITGSFTDTWYE